VRLAARPRILLEPNSPSCGNQPANIRLTTRRTPTRSPPPEPAIRTRSGAHDDGPGHRFTLPLDRTTYISGLRWADVDLDRATLRVEQTVQRVGGRLLVDETKSEASDGTIPQPKVTRLALIQHRERQRGDRETAGEIWQEHDLVFPTSVGTPMEPRSLNRHFDGVRTRAGLPGVRLHDFRHTVVSLLLELGTPPHVVQAIARHADLDVTLSIYAHTNLDAMREALDKIEWEI
jgi:integrase